MQTEMIYVSYKWSPGLNKSQIEEDNSVIFYMKFIQGFYLLCALTLLLLLCQRKLHEIAMPPG